MENKKSTVIILVIAALIIGAGAAVAFMYKGGGDKVTTTAPTVSQSEAVESTDATTEAQTESTTLESTTESTTAAPDYSFLKSGIWYYYVDSSREAYAFQFTDDDDVNVSYFDESNIDGEDAKFFTGDGDYKVENSSLIIDDVPSSVPVKKFVFKIDGENIIDENENKLEMVKKNKPSVEPPFNHFNS